MGRIWKYSAQKGKIISYILNATSAIEDMPILSPHTKIFLTLIFNNLGSIKTGKKITS